MLNNTRLQAEQEGNDLLRNNFVKQNKPSAITIKETIKRHPDLQQKYDFVGKLSIPAIKEVSASHPELSNEIGVRHYDSLKNMFGDDHEKVAHAYKFGIGSAKKMYNITRKPALTE